MTHRPMRTALYARVSTSDQTTENQLLELRQYTSARGWTTTEYIDQGISGTKPTRPALDAMVNDARRRRFDVLVVWRLDRLGRSLKHLVTLLDDLQALGVSFVSLGEGIDCTTPAGTLQLHILAALAQFERARIVERVRAGMARAKKDGKRLGRRPHRITEDDLARVEHLSQREAAKALQVPRSVLQRARVARKGPRQAATFAPDLLLGGFETESVAR
jgi:DNA invertase Pin-like site-specific DNA recombinase